MAHVDYLQKSQVWLVLVSVKCHWPEGVKYQLVYKEQCCIGKVNGCASEKCLTSLRAVRATSVPQLTRWHDATHDTDALRASLPSNQTVPSWC